MIYVAVLGHGVVGSGVVEVMRRNAASIAHKAGDELQVKRILDLREFPDLPYADRFTKDFPLILNDPDIRIVVETMGGLNPAYDYVLACLNAGKSVVTSNKELVAARGDELLEVARAHNVNFLFEASVGGGIPILRPLDQCLAANEVYEIAGILNGTTNFMLTRMIEEGMTFDEALTLAQKLGYAERDPSADIDGHDACRKTCILGSLAFGKHVFPHQIHTEGISAITPEDTRWADAIDGVIKLIGQIRKLEDGRLHGLVAPMILPKTSLLSDVNDVFNGIMVRGDAIGDVVFYGRGAGKLPTASAVVADVIDEAKHLNARKFLFWERGYEGYVRDYAEMPYRRLVRVATAEADAVRTAFATAVGGVQEVTPPEGLEDCAAFITAPLNEKEYAAICAKQGGIRPISALRIAEM